MTIDIKGIRNELHRFIVLGLVANAKSSPILNAADILAYRTSRLSNNANHVVVTTHRSRNISATTTEDDTNVQFLIMVLSRFTDATSEQAAEDALDDIDSAIIEEVPVLYDANSNLWKDVQLRQATQPRRTIKLNQSNFRASIFIVEVRT